MKQFVTRVTILGITFLYFLSELTFFRMCWKVSRLIRSRTDHEAWFFSLSASFSCFCLCSFPLYFSLSRKRTNSHTHTLPHTLLHSQSHSSPQTLLFVSHGEFSLTHTHTFSCSYTPSNTVYVCISVSLYLSHPHTHTQFLTFFSPTQSSKLWKNNPKRIIFLVLFLSAL